MNVPKKTGMQWLKDYNKITSKSELALFLNKKWVLLEDHQKNKNESNDLMYKAGITDAKKLMAKEGWLSPEQLKEKIEKERDLSYEGAKIVFEKDGWLSPSEIINLIDECFKRGIIDFDQRSEIINVFGVGGAKPK